MMKSTIAAACAATLGLCLVAGAPLAADAGPQSGYARVNGLEMYYEVHGEGEPALVLIHGGAGATGMFDPILPALSEGRRVVAVDLQAHGRTADIDRPLRCDLLADDIGALMAVVGLDRADLMGYSLGGCVALQAAIRHPDLVRKLVVVSAPFAREGWYPEVRAEMDQISGEGADLMKQSPMYQNYAAIAPRPEDWPVLFDKLGGLLREDFDWSTEIAAIQAPTMLVFADADSVSPAHVAAFFEILGGGLRDAGWDGSARPAHRLAVLPGTTHYDLFAAPLLAPAVVPFLDAPMPAE